MSAIEYLEKDRVDKLESDLRAKGYMVVREKQLEDVIFDLYAERGAERLVYEVKARAKLGADGNVNLRHLREVAARNGVTDFRFAVVNPPHQTQIEVDGLEDALLATFEADVPSGLQQLASSIRIAGVSGLEIDEINMAPGGTHLSGTGVVDVELEYGGGSGRDGTEMRSDFPFSFDVLLDSQLQVDTVNELSVDTASFYE